MLFMFSKSYDTVSHNIVMNKLEKYGLDKWIVSGLRMI